MSGPEPTPGGPEMVRGDEPVSTSAPMTAEAAIGLEEENLGAGGAPDPAAAELNRLH